MAQALGESADAGRIVAIALRDLGRVVDDRDYTEMILRDLTRGLVPQETLHS